MNADASRSTSRHPASAGTRVPSTSHSSPSSSRRTSPRAGRRQPDDVRRARVPVRVDRERVADAPGRPVLDTGRVALEAVAIGLPMEEQHLEPVARVDVAPSGRSRKFWRLRTPRSAAVGRRHVAAARLAAQGGRRGRGVPLAVAPANTGSTSLDGRAPPRATVFLVRPWSIVANSQRGRSPPVAVIVTRMREPARKAWATG